MRGKNSIILLALLMLLLAACGGGDADTADSSPAGDPARGETLYKQPTIGSANAPGCAACHSLEPDLTLVGPSHVGITTRAETAVAGKSAEEFLRESILNPDAVVTEGFTPGVMYQNYGNDLTEQEIDDLVAFLLTLK